MIGEIRMQRSFRRQLLNTVLAQLVTTIAVVLLIVPFAGGWKHFGTSFVYGFAYANGIGWLAWLVMPRVGVFCARVSPVRRWTLLIAAMVVIAVVGSLIAIAALAAGGMFPWTLYWARFRGGFQTALVVTLATGAAFSLFESYRYRLYYTNAQARLASLESQIQPHFFFNTLNTISSLIPEDPTAAERMTERLAALLRYSLDSTNHWTVPLESELKVAVDYLEIQKNRFGDRLQYSIDVPASLMQLRVPPFSLQTLLENSVKYGGREIRVSARERDGRLVLHTAGNGNTYSGTVELEVWDSGEGFAKDAMKAGHGLDNLRSRLTILWGFRALLEVLRENNGCVVRISVPRVMPQ